MVDDADIGRGSAIAMVIVNVLGLLFIAIWFVLLGASVMGFDATGTEDAPNWVWVLFDYVISYPVVYGLSVVVGWILWATGKRRWGRRFAFLPVAWVAGFVVLLGVTFLVSG